MPLNSSKTKLQNSLLKKKIKTVEMCHQIQLSDTLSHFVE